MSNGATIAGALIFVLGLLILGASGGVGRRRGTPWLTILSVVVIVCGLALEAYALANH